MLPVSAFSAQGRSNGLAALNDLSLYSDPMRTIRPCRGTVRKGLDRELL